MVNASAYDLAGAVVTATPAGATTASCDIVNGAVAAGATVTCQVTYVVTAEDIDNGSFDVGLTLSGTLPVGPASRLRPRHAQHRGVGHAHVLRRSRGARR
ncbi:DUF7507 domain-containing protein [Demequina litorisediminis]|uniref:DUF7507 domain-containing protein n=1 Tax=Demequina litorisediminis TaxID=1849022 RepID=UPI003D6709DB